MQQPNLELIASQLIKLINQNAAYEILKNRLKAGEMACTSLGLLAPHLEEGGVDWVTVCVEVVRTVVPILDLERLLK